MNGAAIYLVDDHPMLREGLRTTLVAAGHRVVGEAGEPATALADLQRLRPEVALLDMHLGEHSGLGLLERIRERGLPVRCLVVSMSAHPRHVAHALRLGAVGYVLKGASADELLTAVELARRGGRYLSPALGDAVDAAVPVTEDDRRLEALSLREQQIVQLVVRGRSSTEIGRHLHLSPKTVDSYRSRLMTKLGVPDVPALVRLAIRGGLLDADEP